MEYDTNILHAAYLKHAYVHAQAHSTCDSQCSSILLGSMSGIVLAAENICSSSWYRTTPIQTLIYRACQRGLSCYGMDVYCPMAPTDIDAIAIRESGIRSITFHKEYMDQFDFNWETYRSIPFLEVNNVIVRCWTGKVTKKDLNIKIHGKAFQP